MNNWIISWGWPPLVGSIMTLYWLVVMQKLMFNKPCTLNFNLGFYCFPCLSLYIYWCIYLCVFTFVFLLMPAIVLPVSLALFSLPSLLNPRYWKWRVSTVLVYRSHGLLCFPVGMGELHSLVAVISLLFPPLYFLFISLCCFPLTNVNFYQYWVR